ncbi:MAG: ABC transporter ATP-binding protein [Proteobacteria bacterium]|nr:ABC transporter ATP-binding protein [Pseudomonadota bacterium]
MTAPLLEVRNLRVHFPAGGGWVHRPRGVVRAVDGVSLSLEEGEILALVGESGCGKTTLGRAILGLVAPTSGAILFEGSEVTDLAPAERRGYHRHVQMIFQDPFDSLNPRKTVLQTLAQPLRNHGLVPAREQRAAAAELLDHVGLSPGRAFLDRYPHQFSGGQRQRICIARALAVRPRIIVADEAVSALDISIRAQILKLLRKLQEEFQLSYLFITHDLGVVRSLCDRVAVMYLGRMVEEGATDSIFTLPRHPYTSALLAASPMVDPEAARRRTHIPLAGDVPSAMRPPPGCRFHPRCPIAATICREAEPPLLAFEGGRRSACHFAAEAPSWTLAAVAKREDVA